MVLKVINMSFGKAVSPEKVKHFNMLKDKASVLLVKAAGNENEDIQENFIFLLILNLPKTKTNCH